jgi:multidrug efflux pump subunit AcrA (membrane-fusion protein)
MEASVPVEDITSLNKGSIVECFFADSTTVRGRIVRIGKTIDRTTQTIKVFAQFIASKYSRLRDGMYVSAIVEGKAIEDVARIPRTALVTASEIYTVSTDSTLIRTPVSVERLEGTEAFIRGLQDSTRILSEALVDAREGMKVRFAGKTE